MRIYLQPPQPSRGLQRIADALFSGVPDGWLPTPYEDKADLVVLYAIGRCNSMTAKARAIKASGRKYAVIQVCLRSTLNPSTWDWLDLWQGAELVWSYYDLRRLHEEDGAGCGYWETQEQMDRYDDDLHDGAFYHSPLGADAVMFRDMDMPKHYTIATSGLSRLSESVRECELATAAVSGRMFHLGPKVTRAPHVACKTGLADLQLAIHYSACEFVSGLRRKEGFELPAIEGLLCGARPIVFDTPDYRWNYGHHAIYIQETSREEVIDQLVEIFKRGAPPVSEEERQRAVERYDWKKIVGGFYERLR